MSSAKLLHKARTHLAGNPKRGTDQAFNCLSGHCLTKSDNQTLAEANRP